MITHATLPAFLKRIFVLSLIFALVAGPLPLFAHGGVAHGDAAHDENLPEGWAPVPGHDVYEEARSESQLLAAAQQSLAIPNLVAAYGMNEPSGLTVFDQSGTGNTATVNGGAVRTTAGKFGGAVLFDGSNDFLSIPDNASLDLTTGTIEAWVKPTTGNRYHGIFSKGTSNTDESDNYSMEIASNNRPYCVVGNGSSARVVNAPAANAVTLNTFTHIACTWGSGTLRLYINGTQVASGTYTLTPWNNTAPLVIGQHSGNADRFLGVIDEARVYNRALSQAEIQADMNLPIEEDSEEDSEAPSVSLTAPLDGASLSGTVAIDATASDNVGVAGVQFMLDGVNFGAEDTIAPYSISWDTKTVTNASHTLTARARDASGNTTDSGVVSVSVSNAPQLVITSPANGASISSSTVAITYTTTGDTTGFGVDHVHFVLDGGPEKMDLTYDGSYQLTNVPTGSHVLNGFLVRADHTKINGTDAVPVSFGTSLPDTTPPVVSITAPSSGATVSGSVNVAATASDNVAVIGVQFMLDGVNLGAEDTTAPYSVSWSTTGVTNGNHTLTARARDAAGNTTTSVGTVVIVSNTNLVAAYGFNEGVGTTTIDTSGKGNNGVLSSATWSASGKYGGALSFNGTNTLVNIPDSSSLDLTNGMTIEAWVRPTTLSGWRTILGKENGSSNLAYTLMANNNTSGSSNQRPISQIRIGSNTRTVTGTTKLPVNTWTHVASTYDGAMMRLYVNGTQVATFATTGNITTTNNQLRIGGIPALGGRYFNGLIDEVRIYNRALSQSEIQTDLNTPIAGETVLPSVAITAPSEGATVTGTTTITASASDNVAVAGVQFQIDGVNFGVEDTAAPYSVQWNTLSLIEGSAHTVSAVARDTSGNSTTAAPVNVTVSNPPKLVITSPINNGTTTTTTLNITYTTSGNTAGFDVNHVHFRVDGGPELMDFPPMDGVFQISDLTSGSHTLDGFLVRIDHTKINGSDSPTVPFAVALPDSVPPTVSVTSPTGGSTVSATTAVTASAADNVGVAGVQFMSDGNNIGAEDTTAPYSVNWDTTIISNGSHILTARARDGAGNLTTSSGVTVTVSNTNDPASIGQWSAPFSLPIVALHLAQLNTGKILMWEGQDNGGISARVWDPATGTLTATPNNATNLFCAGHVQLGDGRIMTMGGHDGNPGVKDANAFNAATQSWTSLPAMSFARWYPTGTVLTDGRVVVTSGSNGCFDTSCSVPQVEVYNPATNAWTTLPSSANYGMGLYPNNFALSNGKLLSVGAGYDGVLDARTLDFVTNTWSVVDPLTLDGQTAVMYAPDKVMVTGKNYVVGSVVNGHGRTYVLDMTQASPAWRQTASMNFPRVYNTATLLPDGTTLVASGGRTTNRTNQSQGVLPAEMWSPSTETWTTMASAQIPRFYHSAAALLADGRVLVSGSGADEPMVNQYNGEIFSPPYLFKGARPTITNAPATVIPGSSFFVATPDSASIARVTMIRTGTMTHSFNPDQRFIELSFTGDVGGITVTAPAANVAPPGDYFLFILNGNGVPSVAPFVRIPQ